MKKIFSILLLVLIVFSLLGCDNSSPNTNSSKKDDVYKISVVTDVGSLTDGGYNQGTHEGVVSFAEDNDFAHSVYQPAHGANTTVEDRIAAMKQAVAEGADVIVTPGYLQAEAIETIVQLYPNVKVIFVDGWNMGYPNLTAICYKEEQSGFFVGYAAVKEGYRKLGGTFGGGGTNISCNRYAYGYLQGIDAAAKDLGVYCDVVISFKYGESYNPSDDLESQVSKWYSNGTEVVFSCGGSILKSVIAAADKTDYGKIIGVDVDQTDVSDRIITSAVKGLSASVYKVLSEWNRGEWDDKLADKTSSLGAADNATGIPTASGSWRFNNFTVSEYNDIFRGVVEGTYIIKDDINDNMSNPESWNVYLSQLSHVRLTVE